MILFYPENSRPYDRELRDTRVALGGVSSDSHHRMPVALEQVVFDKKNPPNSMVT